MATVTKIVLVILTIHCAIVLSEHEAAQRNDRSSQSSAEQQRALIIENQQQLLKNIKERHAAVTQLKAVTTELQADVKRLQAEFACLENSPCASDTCKLMLKDLRYNQKHKKCVSGARQE